MPWRLNARLHLQPKRSGWRRPRARWRLVRRMFSRSVAMMAMPLSRSSLVKSLQRTPLRSVLMSRGCHKYNQRELLNPTPCKVSKSVSRDLDCCVEHA